MFTKGIVSIASVFLATAAAMAQSAGETDAVGNTAIDAYAFNQFQSLVKSKAPENLDATSLQAFVDAVTDYIYGYSLLAIAITERVATAVPDSTSTLGRAPINQIVVATKLPDQTYQDVVLPSTTTLYASSFMDLSSGPLILHIPVLPAVVGVGRPRFFIVQLLDGWTNVSRDSPSSRMHSPPGDYLLVGPGGTTLSTAGYAGVITFDTNTVWSILRFFTDGSEADLSALNAALSNPADKLSLRPASAGTDYTPPSDLAVNPSIDRFTQPIQQVDNMDACAFFETFSMMMMTNPPRSIDVLVEKSLQNLGLLTAKHPFSCVSLADQSEIAILEAAVVAAKLLLGNINPPSASAATNWWSLPLNVGDYGINYILRTLVAQKALGANRPQDAVYGYGAYDNHGIDTSNLDLNKLDGANRYVVHFNPETSAHRAGEIPPVNGGGTDSSGGFWSVTVYDGNGFLVKNLKATYNAIGMPFVQDHKACLNADKSLDLYIQSDQPSDPKQLCNWLEVPQPDGSNATTSKFILFLRMYWPDRAVLNGTWTPPAIVKQ